MKSLRDPNKKMSKSDPDWRSCVFVNDPPDLVAEKMKTQNVNDELDQTFDLFINQ